MFVFGGRDFLSMYSHVFLLSSVSISVFIACSKPPQYPPCLRVWGTGKSGGGVSGCKRLPFLAFIFLGSSVGPNGTGTKLTLFSKTAGSSFFASVFFSFF